MCVPELQALVCCWLDGRQRTDMSGHQVKFSVSSNFLFPNGLQPQDGLEHLTSGARWGRSISALLSQTLLLDAFPGIVLNGAVLLGWFHSHNQLSS